MSKSVLKSGRILEFQHCSSFINMDDWQDSQTVEKAPKRRTKINKELNLEGKRLYTLTHRKRLGYRIKQRDGEYQRSVKDGRSIWKLGIYQVIGPTMPKNPQNVQRRQ